MAEMQWIDVGPGTQPLFQQVWFLLDDDDIPLLQTKVVRKPTYEKWWLDFQGRYISIPYMEHNIWVFP